jgi:hypothetical protein
MAASPYLQNAAAQVKSAIADVQKQIKMAEADFDRERRDIERAIKQNEAKITALTAGMLAKDNSDSNREIRNQIADLKKDNDSKGQVIGERNSQLNGVVGQRQGLLSRLESLASQIDGLASSSGAQ